MSVREWISGPAWTCFRADFRRRWRRKSFARTLGLLLLIAGLQFVAILGARHLSLGRRGWSGTTWFLWLYSLLVLLSTSSFSSPFTLAFWVPLWSRSSSIVSYLLLQGIASLPWLACHFLMPAYAAGSIAPDREQRRIPDLILAGLSPRQILIAKGLAAVLPFLLVAGAGLVASGVLLLREKSFDTLSTYLDLSPRVLFLSLGSMAAAGLLFSAAIQICVSALSRRTLRAVVLCYCIECLLTPILHLASQYGWMLGYFANSGSGSSVWRRAGPFLVPSLTLLLLQAVALLLLWPQALRALAYPDEAAGSRSASIPDVS